MLKLEASKIGGGYVRRRFSSGPNVYMANDKLTGDEIRSIPERNRNALIEMKSLDIYPIGGDGGYERHVVRHGAKYDVIEGKKLNDEPLSREDADKLAGKAPEAEPPVTEDQERRRDLVARLS